MNRIFLYFIISVIIVITREECDFVQKAFICMGEDSKSLMFDFNSKNNIHDPTEAMIFNKINYSSIEHFLTAIDENIKENVKSIGIIACELQEVSEYIAVNYPKLKILDLSENDIEKLDFVSKLPKELEELYLRKNKISTVPDVFTDLQMLKVIDLSSCNIETVNFMVFKKNLHLELVNVSHNQIKSSESEEFLKNIKCVDLSYNKLEKYTNIPSLCLDFSYTDMTGYHWYNISENNRTVRVEKFYFSGNRQLKLLASNVKNESLPIEVIYLNISNFKGDLSVLQLEKVKVKKLFTIEQSNIDNLDRSKYDFQLLFISEGTNATLDLSNCSINDITEDYFQNYNLGRLNLCFNNITILKSGVFKNSYIVELDLCYSNLQKIESEALTELHVSALNLSKNHLNNLQFLRQIPIVRYVDVSNNNIQVIYREELQFLVELREINLSNNDIISIHENTFGALNNIKVINLSNNNLQQIKNGTFINIKYLRELYLQNNRIENIDDNAFQYLPSLQIVNLGETNINGINENAFTNVRSAYFNKIYLKDNDISNLHLVCKLFK